MTKLMIGTLLSLALSTLLSCSGMDSKLDEAGVDSVTVSRDVPLSKVGGSPHCQVSLSLQYLVQGPYAANVNAAIVRSDIFDPAYRPRQTKTLTIKEMARQYADNYVKGYVFDYGPLYRVDPNHARSYDEQYSLSGKFIDGPEKFVNYVVNIQTKVGGQEGANQTQALVIDAQSGRAVTLADVFQPGYELSLRDLLVDKLCRQYGAKDLKDLQTKGIFADDEPYVPNNFILRPHSVIFIFCQDEIASHEAGEIRVELSNKELKHVLKN